MTRHSQLDMFGGENQSKTPPRVAKMPDELEPPELRVISLGAGVQSTTLLLMALEGEVQADAAIFADTGWEPRAVYDHFEQLKPLAAMKGFPIYVVSNGNIRDTKAQEAFYDAPYFLLNDDGSHGMARRQCTHQLKLVPIRRKIRELMEERGIKKRPGAVVSLLGISWDEMQRMKPSDVQYIVNEWPLIDRRMTRNDCHAFLAVRDMTAPRSACIGCPYHSDKEWRDLRDNAPAEFDDAVQFELEIQKTGAARRGKPFLHAQRVPLDQVDFDSREDKGQLALVSMDDECAGICGV